MKKTPLLALLGLAVPGVAQDPKPRTDEEMHRRHRDSKADIAMLEDPKRDAYQKPHEVMRALDLKPGEAIADIGSGSGYFTRRIRDAGLSSVQTILAEPDDPLLRDRSIDRFVVVDTWHHIGFRLAQENPFLPYQYVLVFEAK